MVDVRHLKVFLSVADHLSLSRAAADLHVTQSSVSRTLQQLEGQVGLTLLDRSTHHVALTLEGEEFLERAALLVGDFDLLTATRSGVVAPLRVGHAWAALGALTDEVLERWKSAHPGVGVELQRWDDRYAGLLERRVDLAILRGSDPAPGIEMQPLFREARVVAVGSDDPLATRDAVSFSDLHGLPIISNVVSGATKPSWWPGGYHPGTRIRVANMDDWVVKIRARSGFGLASESMQYLYPAPGITYVPLLDGPPIQVNLAWPKRNPHPSTAAFIRVAQQTVLARTSSTPDMAE